MAGWWVAHLLSTVSLCGAALATGLLVREATEGASGNPVPAVVGLACAILSGQVAEAIRRPLETLSAQLMCSPGPYAELYALHARAYR